MKRRIGLGVAVLVALGMTGARAAEYTGITTNYSLYALSDQTDTWTRSELSVTTLYLASNANSTAELRLVSSTNNINGTHYIGGINNNTGVYRAESGSLLRIGGNVSMRRGEFRMTDSTGVVASGKTVTFDLGNAGTTDSVGMTGDVYLVRSRLEQASGGTLDIRAGWNSQNKQGRLFATDSTIIARDLKCGYSQTSDAKYPEGYFMFDHSVVALAFCRLGGTPTYGYNRGFLLLTNGSDMSVSGNLTVGYGSGNAYECKLIAGGSRLTVGGNTMIAQGGHRGLGRITFRDGATGLFSGNVTVGVDTTYNWPSRGYLDVLSGSRVDITNSSGNATLTVGVWGPEPGQGTGGTAAPGGYGRLSVDGGSICRVDNLVGTNALLYGGQSYSAITLNSGTLSVKRGIIANNLTTVIGNGTSPATLELWGRQPFNVTSNLVFSNNSTLSVEIGGSATNDCNYLDVHGALTFDPGTALDVELARLSQLGDMVRGKANDFAGSR